jgi:hypothetical protein
MPVLSARDYRPMYRWLQGGDWRPISKLRLQGQEIIHVMSLTIERDLDHGIRLGPPGK